MLGGSRGRGTGTLICTFCGVLTTPGKWRCRGELLSHGHVTAQKQDKYSMPPWRFPTNSAMRDASDLGHRLPLPSFSPFLCVSKICQIQALEDCAAHRQGPACPARTQGRWKDAPRFQACLLRPVSHALGAVTAHSPNYWTLWEER